MKVFCLSALLGLVLADLPIHCSHKQVIGTWEFTLTAGGHTNQEYCGYKHPDANANHFKDQQYSFVADDAKTFQVKLGPSAKATHPETEAHIGDYTMVYDEGFELNMDGSKFFSFFEYAPKPGVDVSSDQIGDYTSNCQALRVGWYHGKDGQDFGCYKAKMVKDRDGNPVEEVTHDMLALGKFKQRFAKSGLNLHHDNIVSRFSDEHDEKHFKPSYSFVEAVNSDRSMSWSAKVHEQFKGKNMKHMQGLVGKRTWRRNLKHGHGHGVDRHTGKLRVSPASKPHNEDDLRFLETLPENFDWRDVDGVNFIAPVKNQLSCGSCYAMAATSVLEARLKIRNQGNDKSPKLSTQDVLSCSATNQGCEGGYPFLVVKYGAEYGMVEEDCLPYEGSDNVKCKEECHSKERYQTSNYRYVGGYYGGCNEAAMMKEVYTGGPVVVAFEAPSELFYYDGGVFSGAKPKSEEQPHEDGVNNWEQTNHAVVAVGWGVDKDHGKYWTIKNTWGQDWGEKGYFRIKRGTDECGMESMAVTADITPKPVSFLR